MKYIIITILLLGLACTNQSPEYKRYKETLGKTLNLSMFNAVIYKGETIAFEEFRNKYKYISVVYLQSHCHSCYEKYIEWHKEMEKLNQNNYTLLFIINEKFADEFLNEVSLIANIDEKYFIRMDPKSSFLKENFEIPQWLIENSLLIDNKNKIKLIGEPFYNPELTKQFLKIVKK